VWTQGFKHLFWSHTFRKSQINKLYKKCILFHYYYKKVIFKIYLINIIIIYIQ
jgi:hypothetical protein